MAERIEISGQMIPGLKRLAVVEEQIKAQANGEFTAGPRLPQPVDARISVVPSRERRPYFVR